MIIMGKIKVLDRDTINKIAAGEIIERPASVVKELLENSIDAQADFIEIEIREGGLSLIRVTDNGVGMDKEDCLLAFQRHATSKINSAHDLFNITSFGFRGEALASIGAVSQVLLTSRTNNEAFGHQVSFIGGQLKNIEEIAFNPGTTLEVRNLFFNTPARRKFMKSTSYEAGLITELVTKYSLGHPTIRFKLINNRETVYDTAGLNSVEDRLALIYGDNVANKFLHLPNTELLPGHNVEAWLAQNTLNRNTRNQQTFFINGRMIRSQELSKVLDEAYHTLIPKGRFPLAVLYLQLPSRELDVNIHPAKLQIKINNLDNILNKLVNLFKQSLWSYNDSSIKFLDKTNDKSSKEYLIEHEIVKETPLSYKEEHKEEKPKELNISQEKFFFTDLNQTYSPPKEKTEKFIHFPKQTVVKNSLQQGISVKKIKDLKPIGQLNNSFILAENKQGLYIIDQHACHERILYEKFMVEEEKKEIISESPLIPITLKLTGKQEAVLLKNILILKDCGFIVENFGPRTFILRGVPMGLTKVDIEKDFLDLLEELAVHANLSKAKIKEKIIIMAACKSAVKANQPLSQEEIVFLLKELDKVENAQTCPHGRPIFYHLSMEELFKIFLRGEYPKEAF